MIIGLTGTLSSGKGTVAEFLKRKGFGYLSLSDELREEARRRKIELTRTNLQNLGNQLREAQGPGVLAKLVLEKINSNNLMDAVVDGIRNPAEIKELKQLPHFFLVAVDAPEKTRFERMKSRNRENDPKTFDAFKKVDARDKGKGEKASGQQVAKCFRMASVLIRNDKTVHELNSKSEQLLKKLREIELKRPDIDEYFLKIASLVGERSTCRRHHIGAVIVRGKHLLTTGYNGAAAGIKDCLELGCLRNQMKIASGTRHEICRAIHAEQNAIIQAALHNIDTTGATIYCTSSPCIICAKMIVNAKIKRFVTYGDYPDKSFLPLFKEAKVEFAVSKEPQMKINKLK
jgi:dCMP deaminase